MSTDHTHKSAQIPHHTLHTATNQGDLVKTYLIPVPPKEFLRPDVLVRVLDLFLKRWVMLLVLPVLVPQAPGIHARHDQTGDHDVDGEFAPEI